VNDRRAIAVTPGEPEDVGVSFELACVADLARVVGAQQ